MSAQVFALAGLAIVLAWLSALARMLRREEIEAMFDGPDLEARSRLVEKLWERIQARKARGAWGRR